MKNILIFGATGLLGSNFLARKNLKFNIFILENKRKCNLKKYEIVKFKVSKKNLEDFVKKKKINLILNFSAYTSIDQCEKNKKKAYQANVQNVDIICEAIKNIDAKLIHISTDHIFQNSKKKFSETSKLKEWNYYSKTKILSDNIISKKLKKYIIIRTSFFGWGTSYRKSFSDNILENLEKKIKKYYWSDIFFSPVYMGYLVEIIKKLIKKDEFNGIINVSSNEKVSKYQFAKKIYNQFKYDKNFVASNKFDSSVHVKRPKNMSLSNRRLKKILKIKGEKLSLKSQINYMKRDIKIKNLLSKI